MVRWYDRFTHIRAMLHLAEKMPYAAKKHIGKNLLESIQRYHMQYRHAERGTFKNLGSQAVLRLYKSKRKLRWYDQIPELHIALNTMMVALPENVLQQIDMRCAQLLNHIRQLDGKAQTPSDVAVELKAYLDIQPFIEVREHSSHLHHRYHPPHSND